MFTFAIMLAVLSTGIEMFFVVQYETVRKFMINHKKFGLFFSFALSYALGTMFGAAGLIAMTAAIASTALSLVIYESGALKYAEPQNRAQITARVKKNTDLLVRTIKFWFKIFTAPVRAIIWCKDKVDATKSKFQVVKAKFAR